MTVSGALCQVFWFIFVLCSCRSPDFRLFSLRSPRLIGERTASVPQVQGCVFGRLVVAPKKTFLMVHSAPCTFWTPPVATLLVYKANMRWGLAQLHVGLESSWQRPSTQAPNTRAQDGSKRHPTRPKKAPRAPKRAPPTRLIGSPPPRDPITPPRGP